MLNDYTENKTCFAVINYRPVPVRLVERDNYAGHNSVSYTIQKLSADGRCPMNPHTGIMYGIRADSLYETEAAALDCAEARKAAYIEKVCAGIRSVEDLVAFPLMHDITEKKTDKLYPEKEMNRIAYLRRAKELLNI